MPSVVPNLPSCYVLTLHSLRPTSWPLSQPLLLHATGTANWPLSMENPSWSRTAENTGYGAVTTESSLSYLS